MPFLSKALFEHSPCAHFIFTVGPANELVLERCNRSAAEFYSLDHNCLAGRRLDEILPPALADFLQDKATQCLDGKESITVVFAENSSLEQQFHLHRIDLPQNDAVHLEISFLPNEKLQKEVQAERDRALQASRAKSDFLAGMSHELRTPLNAILGFSELMRNQTFGALGHAKYVEYMNDIHFAAGHLLEIVNDVLDMSKIEAGKFELVEQTVHTADLLQSVSRVMSDRAAALDLTIETYTLSEASTIYADKRVLRQMLFNLVSNALRFSPRGGLITLSATTDEATGRICLAVRDNGQGMASHDVIHLLEPFHQDKASIHSGVGTGLGLSLTRAMAELHGGSLEIESELGKGTTAAILLPEYRILRDGFFEERVRRFG